MCISEIGGSFFYSIVCVYCKRSFCNLTFFPRINAYYNRFFWILHPKRMTIDDQDDIFIFLLEEFRNNVVESLQLT